MGSTDGFSVARGTGVRLSPSSATTSTMWNSSRAVSPRQISRGKEIRKSPQDPPKTQVLLAQDPRGFLGQWGVGIPLSTPHHTEFTPGHLPEGLRRKSRPGPLTAPRYPLVGSFGGQRAESNPSSAAISTPSDSSPKLREEDSPRDLHKSQEFGELGGGGYNHPPPCLLRSLPRGIHPGISPLDSEKNNAPFTPSPAFLGSRTVRRTSCCSQCHSSGTWKV